MQRGTYCIEMQFRLINRLASIIGIIFWTRFRCKIGDSTVLHPIRRPFLSAGSSPSLRDNRTTVAAVADILHYHTHRAWREHMAHAVHWSSDLRAPVRRNRCRVSRSVVVLLLSAAAAAAALEAWANDHGGARPSGGVVDVCPLRRFDRPRWGQIAAA